MLESTWGLNGWHLKDYIMIYKLLKRKIVEQDESNGDSEFITTIGFGNKSS
jgi:hypothetical protein